MPWVLLATIAVWIVFLFIVGRHGKQQEIEQVKKEQTQEDTRLFELRFHAIGGDGSFSILCIGRQNIELILQAASRSPVFCSAIVPLDTKLDEFVKQCNREFTV